MVIGSKQITLRRHVLQNRQLTLPSWLQSAIGYHRSREKTESRAQYAQSRLQLKDREFAVFSEHLPGSLYPQQLAKHLQQPCRFQGFSKPPNPLRCSTLQAPSRMVWYHIRKPDSYLAITGIGIERIQIKKTVSAICDPRIGVFWEIKFRLRYVSSLCGSCH